MIVTNKLDLIELHTIKIRIAFSFTNIKLNGIMNTSYNPAIIANYIIDIVLII